MRYLLVILLFAFGSCNVAKKVFRHKEATVITVHKDSTGKSEAHVDTSKQSSLRVIESTDIVRSGGSVKGEGSTDLDQLKISMDKGRPLVVPILDSIGNMIGSISTTLDPLTNSLKQLVNMNAPPEEYHHSKETNDQQQQNGISDQKQQGSVNLDGKQKNKNQGTVKDVKRSPAWVKWVLVISGMVLVLITFFKRGKIWKWFKNKLIKK